MRWVKAWIISGGAALTAGGCNGTTPPPWRPEAFFTRPGAESGIITRQTDQNGTLVYGELHAPILPDEYPNPKPLVISEPRSIHQQIASTQASVGEPIGPTSSPAGPDTPPGAVSTYQVVGAVVAIVNGKPIYADKILASLDQQLAADARRMNPAQFKASASDKIGQRVQTVVQSQQYLAAAGEFLTAESKSNADMVATVRRIQQVQASGGSEALAKEKALRETGTTLDELAQDRRDEILISIFLEQRVHPLIEVTPTDMRQYYEQHIADFTQTAEAKFRLIKIDVAKRGGAADEAALVVTKVMDKLRARTNFEEVAKLYNDDPNGGIVAGGGWVQKGSYVNDDIENAVWKLMPGEFTDPPIRVADQNAYYIAQLDAKKNGNVQPFEDTGVQVQIEQILRGKQFAELQQGLTEKLMRQSVTTYIDGWHDTILDMAMQRYAAWTTSK